MSAASQRAKAHKQNKSSGTQTFSDNGLSSQIAAIQGQIQGATVPGADETALSTSLGNIQGASAVGQANAQDPTKNPVALGFQTGQAAAIDTQANAASVPLTQRLALLQSNRKANLDAYNTNLGFMQDKYNQENTAFNDKQSQANAQAIAKINANQRMTYGTDVLNASTNRSNATIAAANTRQDKQIAAQQKLQAQKDAAAALRAKNKGGNPFAKK
jgi:hypothetical protein